MFFDLLLISVLPPFLNVLGWLNISFPFSLLRNPVTNKPYYRLFVIHKLPQLRVLDFQRIKMRVRY
jgi:hypothetical protein